MAPFRWLLRYSRQLCIFRIGYKPSAGSSSGHGSVSPSPLICDALLKRKAWFPFLFYGPTWVGEVYFRYSGPAAIKESTDKLGDIGRIGSLSLVAFSMVTFTSSILLPWVIQPPEGEKNSFTPRPPPAIAAIATTLYSLKPDLLTAWMLSHLLFAGAMSLAPFVQSLRFATVLIAICGIPWALASWAPFTFIGMEINRLTRPNSTILTNIPPSYHRISTEAPMAIDVDSPPPSPQILRLNHLDRDLEDDIPSNASTGEMAGIYLGILNLYTTLPQFVGTFISMCVFAILEPGKHPELAGEGEGGSGVEIVKVEGVNAIAVCLFIGALSSIGAAWATRRFGFVG